MFGQWRGLTKKSVGQGPAGGTSQERGDVWQAVQGVLGNGDMVGPSMPQQCTASSCANFNEHLCPLGPPPQTPPKPPPLPRQRKTKGHE